MRELKFRAWDTGAKRWTSGVMPVLTWLSLELKPAHSGIIIEQYTGLKDKNGKEICEGDIVKTCSIGTWAVEGRRGCFFVGKYALYGYNDYGEVIGNIHENPELLKEK